MEEDIKKLAREEMLDIIKSKLDSSMIFTYVKGLEEKTNNELTILSKIKTLKERINNKENKADMLEEINKVLKNIQELPIQKEFRELFLLYEETYDEYLFGGKND